MSIRVIAGTAKGRRLKLVPGDSTRPIMDRVKEALFNIIGRRIFDAQFLDLFAGTGSVGIEALSRGAAHALLTDLDARAVKTIQENLALTGFTNKATVRKQDAFTLLKAQADQAFDFIYIAPPQYKGLWSAALHALDSSPGWLAAAGQAIAQIDPTEYEAAALALEHLTLSDERRYGNTLLLFFGTKPALREDESRG